MIYVNPNVQDSYRTGYVIASFVCDTEAELPANNYITGYTLEMGCKAFVIENATQYIMQSDGTWCSANKTDLQYIIDTLSDIEPRLETAEQNGETALNYISDLRLVIAQLINDGAKNVLDLTPAATTTDNGITFTVNSDFSITLTGIASATAWIHVPVTIPAGDYIFKGLTEDGSTSTYRLDLRNTPTSGVMGVCDSEDGNPLSLASDFTGYFNVRVASGYDCGAGVTVYPMIALEKYLEITQEYRPYAPTNKQLFDMIRT